MPVYAKKLAEINSYYYLFHFSNEDWQRPHLDLAVENCLKKTPCLFLDFYQKEWSKPYLNLAAKECVKANPSKFMDLFWDNPNIDKKESWYKDNMESAMSKIYGYEVKLSSFKTPNYSLELLKLSKVLSGLGLRKEAALLNSLILAIK